jgi:hypothetical protein
MFWRIRHLISHHRTHPDCLCCRVILHECVELYALVGEEGWNWYIFIGWVLLDASLLGMKIRELGWIR